MMKYIKRTEKNEDKYHWFDGRIVSVDSVLDQDKDLVIKRDNYIHTNNSFRTERGMTVASEFMGTYVSINVFNEFKTDSIDDVNETDQWLTGSKDLTKSAYVGYIFSSGEDFYLNSCRFVPRVGPKGKAGLKSPAPKVISIEGYNGSSWEAISDDISLNDQEFLEVTDIDFGDAVDVPMSGFRLVVKEWYPGAEPDMITGLYKLEFNMTPATKVMLENKGLTKRGCTSCIDKKISTSNTGVVANSVDNCTVNASIVSGDSSNINITSVTSTDTNILYPSISYVDTSVDKISTEISSLRSEFEGDIDTLNEKISDNSNKLNEIEVSTNEHKKTIEFLLHENTTNKVTVDRIDRNVNIHSGDIVYLKEKTSNSICTFLTDYESSHDIDVSNNIHNKIIIYPILTKDNEFKLCTHYSPLGSCPYIFINNIFNNAKFVLSTDCPFQYNGQNYNTITLEPGSFSIVLHRSAPNYINVSIIQD